MKGKADKRTGQGEEAHKQQDDGRAPARKTALSAGGASSKVDRTIEKTKGTTHNQGARSNLRL